MMTMTELSKLLGVSRQQVWAWHDRRARNGFPEHDHLEPRRNGPSSRVWDEKKVVAWRESYVPELGGRKRKTV